MALSGIVSTLFCGIAINHYTTKALSERGLAIAGVSLKILSGIAETIVFMLVGGGCHPLVAPV